MERKPLRVSLRTLRYGRTSVVNAWGSGGFSTAWKKFSTVWKMGDSGGMNTFLSAAMILWIFGMVIYLTKDM